MPKTVDNDLPLTDTCPGFGSAAKYTAVSVREAALDVAAMADTSTKVFVYEAMGRHAGWLAAAAGLAGGFVRWNNPERRRFGWCLAWEVPSAALVGSAGYALGG
ncbi:6-phosphofructokinase, partial [Acinetobacter baumannii]